MVTNKEIAAVFDELAALLERKGDLVFKTRAYRRVAETLRGLPYSIEERVARGASLRKIPGIGEAIDKKIREYMDTGKVQTLERLKSELGDR
jgi:DNA polymerase (family 10)